MTSRVLRVVITIMIMVFTAYLLYVAFVGDPLEKIPRVKNLQITQDGTEVTARWDNMDCKGYTVSCQLDGRLLTIQQTSDNTWTFNGVKPGQFCTIVVGAKTWPHLSLKAKETLQIDRYQQNITVGENSYYGFAGNDLKLNASAIGKLRYRSTDKRVASVDSSGHVTLRENGEAEIMISAEGNNCYQDAERTVSVFVYPAVIDKITGTAVEYLSPTKALIRWNPDEYATAYKVLRKNPCTGEYEELKETSYDVNFLEVVRDDFDYAIKGIAEVDGVRVDGKLSDEMTVRGTTEEAKSYSKLKIIGKLRKSDLELMARVHGNKKAKIPEAVSVTGDTYTVTYINGNDTRGYLICYNKQNGAIDRSTAVKGINHGNGCAYDPYRERLYVLAGKNGERSKKCFVYDPDTHKRIAKIKLPVAAAGIAYDVSNDKFYLTFDDKMYVCDSSFRLEKTLKKSIRYVMPQDIGAYNGAILVGTSTSTKTSYVDIYRVSDGAYLGSYDVSLGEIESVAIDDGYLVILMNTVGSLDDKIYKTKKRIAIP